MNVILNQNAESGPDGDEAMPTATSGDRVIDGAVIPARVVFLTHYIPLYQVPVLKAIARRVKDFHVLVSTRVEPNRDFEPDWDDLDVSIQKTLTVRRSWNHRGDDSDTSFVDPLFVHVPYDTKRRLNQLNPDVVMSLELGTRSLGAIRYCQKNPHAKSILCTYMSEHTETNRGWLREKLRRYLIARADAITYNGPSCKRYLRRLGADANRLHRLAYAADDRSAYRGDVRRNETTTRPRLLCVGQLNDRKGILPMLRQLTDYCKNNPSRNIELRFAGTGPLHQTIANFDAPENLSLLLLGNVPPQELGDEMMRCGATIAPTLADEWLLVVNEALQAGMPVIGSVYAQATTTLIRDGLNGWQYDPTDSQSLAKVLDRYFQTSPDELAAMRLRCRESIGHCTPNWAAAGAIEAIAKTVGVSTQASGCASGGEA